MAINLLGREARGPSKIEVARNVLTRTSAIFLVFYMILVVSIVGILFLFNRGLQSEESVNSSLSERVNSLKETEGTLLFLKNRAKLAREAFAQSSNDEIVGRIVSLVPPGAEIMEIVSEDKGFLITVRTPDSQTLVSFFEVIKEQGFPRVVLVSLNQTRDGDYLVSLEIE